MKHPAVTAHLAKPGKHKSFRDVLSNHGGHFAHNLTTRETLIRAACTTHHSVSAKQRLFTSTRHSHEHYFIENSGKILKTKPHWNWKGVASSAEKLFPSISLSWHNTGVEDNIGLPLNWIKFPANKGNWTLRNYFYMLPDFQKKEKSTRFFHYCNTLWTYICTINRKLLTVNMLKRLLSPVWFKN